MTKSQCPNTTESVDEATAKEMGLLAADWRIWGRRVCTVCGNAIVTTKTGQLRKHVAKRATL